MCVDALCGVPGFYPSLVCVALLGHGGEGGVGMRDVTGLHVSRRNCRWDTFGMPHRGIAYQPRATPWETIATCSRVLKERRIVSVPERLHGGQSVFPFHDSTLNSLGIRLCRNLIPTVENSGHLAEELCVAARLRGFFSRNESTDETAALHRSSRRTPLDALFSGRIPSFSLEVRDRLQ